MPAALIALAVMLPAALGAQDRVEAVPGTPPQSPPLLRAEVPGPVASDFDRMDANKDGFVSFAEFNKPYGGDAYQDPMQQSLFGSMDGDKDSRLSKQEMIDWSLRLFDCLDADRDGKLFDPESRVNALQCMQKFVPMPAPRQLETRQAE